MRDRGLVSEAGEATAALERPAPATRRLPVGAEPQPRGGVHFRLWAPACRDIAVEIETLPPVALHPEDQGYFSGLACDACPGMRYRFRPDRGDQAWPDPASR